jgi:tetratricopeptide (TPR) repeat protein/Zn-dependent protease with chaperone function
MPFLSAFIHLVAACLMAALANWAGLIPWRRATGAHWTERARLLWPVRLTAGINVFLIPVVLFQAHWLLFPGTSQWWISDGIASFMGALLGCYPFDREIFPQLGFRNWWHQVIAGWGIRFGIWVALIAACVLMPENFGSKMLVVAGGYLALHFAIQWGLFLKYLRWVKFLKPAEERLQQIVNVTAMRMNVTVRAIWQLGGPLANAFAFPTTRELVFSNRLLEICTDEEISSICAHELAHLKESKTVLAGRLLGSLSLFPLIFITPLIHQFGTAGIILPYLGLFIVAKFARWLSHRMEKRADQLALTEQTDEGIYASALEKIYRESQIPAVNVNNKQTHPHLYDRMLAAGITPDFPRPAKPRRLTVFGWLYVFLVGIVIGLAASRSNYITNAYAKYTQGDWDGAIADYTKVIESEPNDTDAYIDRGDAKYAKGDWDGAIADYTKAIETKPNDADAYLGRGDAKYSKADWDGALADYNKTIEFKPNDTDAYIGRGAAKAKKGDLDGAIADYTKVIELKPDYAEAYDNRGYSKSIKGDVDGAMADFNKAIQLNPEDAYALKVIGYLKARKGNFDGAMADFDKAGINNQAVESNPQAAVDYMDRGVANYINGQSSEALADFQKAIELKFYYYDYPHIYIWLVKAKKADQLAAANKELAEYIQTRQGMAFDWPAQVCHFLVGDLSQDDFLKAADSSDVQKSQGQHCEAYFYIGMKHLLAGDVVTAKLFFQQCVGTNMATFYEYQMAQAELKRL